jgi:hypothetical protein
MFEFRNWTVAAMAIGLAFSVAACGGDDEEEQKSDPVKSTTAPVKPGVPLNLEPGEQGEIRYSGETEAGDTFKAQLGGDVTLPDEFGGDLPAYPGAVAQSAMETTGGTAIAALESDASASEIVDFYRDQLSSNGWKVEGVSDLGRGRLLTATKGDRRVMVNTEDMDKGARITLTIRTGDS